MTEFKTPIDELKERISEVENLLLMARKELHEVEFYYQKEKTARISLIVDLEEKIKGMKYSIDILEKSENI